MFDAAIKALTQMFSPPFRRVLFKSIGLALLMIVLIGIGLNRVFSWMADSGADLGRGQRRRPYGLAGAGLDSVVRGHARHHHRRALPDAGGDRVRRHVLRRRDRRGGRAHATIRRSRPAGRCRLRRAVFEGTKTALLSILVYLCAVPFLLFAGLGLVIMFVATAYLLSREYFLLAAMRFRSPAEAKAMRRAHRTSIMFAGLLIALFVSIPIVNLATPLFAMAMMVHVHKRLSGPRAELIEPKRA